MSKTDKRQEFYRIVQERLDARIERGEAYTTTRDLYAGYESLVDEPPSQLVAQVLKRAKYAGKLFYAREVTSHRAERSGPGRTSPYRLYLRGDATPPKGYVLVPIDVTGRTQIAEYITRVKGAEDATVHVTQPTQPQAQEPADRSVIDGLLRANAALLEAMRVLLDSMERDGH